MVLAQIYLKLTGDAFPGTPVVPECYNFRIFFILSSSLIRVYIYIKIKKYIYIHTHNWCGIYKVVSGDSGSRKSLKQSL